MIDRLLIASHNAGKVREIEALLAPLGIEVTSAGQMNISEPEETGSTFFENAELKSRHCMQASGLASLSDDSGLVVPAIGGQPGIYSARWAGDKKDFAVAFERIRKELAAAGAPEESPAYFVCVLSLCLPDGSVQNFEGRVYGTLTFPPRGEKGFGYDPIFIPDGHDVTFAEIDANIKNSMSHRAHAFSKFLNYLRQLQAA